MPIVSTGQLTIADVNDGVDGVNVELTKPNIIFTADTDGTIAAGTYTGSGTNITVLVGGQIIDYDATGTAVGKWKVTIGTGVNITAGTVSSSGTAPNRIAVIGDHSNMLIAQNTASITYTIQGVTPKGVSFTITKSQNFSKSKTGSTGPTGASATALTFINAVNCTGSVDTVTRNNSGAGWTAGTRTAETYIGGAFASVVCHASQSSWDVMFGLNTENSSASYEDLEYAIELVSTTIRIYENGTEQGGGTGFGNYTVGDLLSVAYDGNKIIYMKNSSIIYQKSVAITRPIFFDCSLNTPDSKLTNIKFGPLSPVTNQDLVNTKTWSIGTVGLTGTRTAVLEMYKWGPAGTTPVVYPRDTPSGTSTFTWSTGQFTSPEIANGWTLVPGTATASQNLFIARIEYSDSLSTTTTGINWKNVNVSHIGTQGTVGFTGTRIGWLELYRWSATKPTTYPSGNSTYTWATGTFSNPTTLNSWSLLPGAPVNGSILWIIAVPITDSAATPTTAVTWNSTTPYAIDSGGTVYPDNFLPQPTSSTGSNKIALSTLPNGTQGLVWQAVSGTEASSYEGGWDSCGEIAIDRTKMYRFSCYFKATIGLTGSIYLSPKSNTISTLNSSTTDGTIADSGVYFILMNKATVSGAIPPKFFLNEWYFMTGYVYPVGYAGNTVLGGVYRVKTGQLVQAANNSYKWTTNNAYTTTTHRVLQFATTASNTVEFWGPRIEQMDGTEATLDILDIAKVNSTISGNKTTGGRVRIDNSVTGGKIEILDDSDNIRVIIGRLI